MTIEVVVPEDWSPGQALAMRSLLQQALRSGHPIISFARPNATPDQVKNIYEGLEALIRDAGLAA
jgi:hypothetical protein